MLLHLEVAINLVLKRDILKDLVTINLYLNLTHAPEKNLGVRRDLWLDKLLNISQWKNHHFVAKSYTFESQKIVFLQNPT
jgi:hypothetical protein